LKKLLVLILISAIAIFVFTGCESLVPGEGEGEEEGEVEDVTVEIENYYKTPDGKTYVTGGTNKITVTFPAPVANAVAYITNCTGDYSSKQLPTNDDDTPVVLFPNEDKTVWTGSGSFGCAERVPAIGRNGNDLDCNDCCASYIMVKAGECEDDFCIQFPVIVDSIQPYAAFEVSTERCDDPCDTGKCAITFKSTEDADPCGAGEQCCGDDCSGLDGWSIAIYNEDPFDACCLTPCYEPFFTDSGTGCPIEVTTDCLGDDENYYVVVDMVDNVGNETNYYATIEMQSTCLPETVDFVLSWPPDDSYFDIEIDSPIEYDFFDDTFKGWCADAFTLISLNTNYTANIYPSTGLADAPDCIQERPWGSINWILNNWNTYSSDWEDAQVAMWNLIHNPGDPTELTWSCICDIGNVIGDEDNVNNLISNTDPNYVPGPDDLAAAILLVENLCPGLDDAKQMAFFGVARSGIDCPCEIVEVLEYQQNDLGCTDWENPIIKPIEDEYIIGNCIPYRF